MINMKFRNICMYWFIGALVFTTASCGDSVAQPITELPEKIVSPNAVTDDDTLIGTATESLTGSEPAETSASETEFNIGIPTPEFKTELSAYEKYMNPGKTTEYLIVVSREHMLPSTHVPTNLMKLPDTRKDRAQEQMSEYAAMAMEAMFVEMREVGYTDVSITSAYRSYAKQEYLFNYYLSINNNDYDYVATFSNPPGSSEHQTGLCADLHNLPSADVKFGETEAFAWLRDNCHKFGFILRYPEDKVDVTGISYEPWHYRYVGRYHATHMYNEGLCLEEYVSAYYPSILE